MTDAAAVEGQAPETVKPQAGEQAEQQANPQAGDAQDVKGLPEWAQKLIQDTRKEAATSRTKLQKIEDSQKSELEKAQDAAAKAIKDVEDARRELRDRDATDALRTALTDSKVISLTVAVKALRSDLDYDDDGKPTNVKALVDGLRKSDPHLFRAADGGADGGERGTVKTDDMNAMLRRAAGRG